MRAAATPNAIPLSRPQWSALLAATARELSWGLSAVSHEVRAWRRHAAAIPDAALRADALHAIDHKRGHIDGAALFAALPARRNVRLLRLLVRYELLQDYLDGVNERGAALGTTAGGQLYTALADALDPYRPVTDYYRHQPWREDGGYLDALVRSCRVGCGHLPGYSVVRPLLIREAEQSAVLVLNHLPNAALRDVKLERWATENLPHCSELRWYELTAAASGWITTHALLALAASRTPTREEAETTYAAYFPWFALALTLLDSYADQHDDHLTGNHSYFAHYENHGDAVERLCESVTRAAAGVLSLRDGERHAVLLACMVALYLSKDSARAPELRPTTARIAAAGGTLPRLLLPVLRVWRVCNAQGSST
jgi:tetraprenyl-beta-curcumene synthase